MATNLALPLSASPSGTPISITSTSLPGDLIHTAETSSDFMWVWLGLSDYVDFTDAVYVNIVKGNSTLGYSVDTILQIPSNEKLLVESGILISNSCELRAYIDTDASTVTNVPVSATGFVHRRIS